MTRREAPTRLTYPLAMRVFSGARNPLLGRPIRNMRLHKLGDDYEMRHYGQVWYRITPTAVEYTMPENFRYDARSYSRHASSPFKVRHWAREWVLQGAPGQVAHYVDGLSLSAQGEVLQPHFRYRGPGLSKRYESQVRRLKAKVSKFMLALWTRSRSFPQPCGCATCGLEPGEYFGWEPEKVSRVLSAQHVCEALLAEEVLQEPDPGSQAWRWRGARTRRDLERGRTTAFWSDFADRFRNLKPAVMRERLLALEPLAEAVPFNTDSHG